VARARRRARQERALGGDRLVDGLPPRQRVDVVDTLWRLLTNELVLELAEEDAVGFDLGPAARSDLRLELVDLAVQRLGRVQPEVRGRGRQRRRARTSLRERAQDGVVRGRQRKVADAGAPRVRRGRAPSHVGARRGERRLLGGAPLDVVVL
jgi:hypothetical protein